VDEFVSDKDTSQGIHFRKHLRVFLLGHIPRHEGYSQGPLDHFSGAEAEKVMLRFSSSSDFDDNSGEYGFVNRCLTITNINPNSSLYTVVLRGSC
jgi:hypothetical protein